MKIYRGQKSVSGCDHTKLKQSQLQNKKCLPQNADSLSCHGNRQRRWDGGMEQLTRGRRGVSEQQGGGVRFMDDFFRRARKEPLTVFSPSRVKLAPLIH